MSDLPKTRAYEHAPFGNIRAGGIGEVIAMVGHDAADAMRDELLARIAELEDELAESRKREWALDRARKEDAIDHAGDVNLANTLRKTAEAALAERDRMLKRYVKAGDRMVKGINAYFGSSGGQEVDQMNDARIGWQQLRASAEEGSGA